MTRQIIFTPKGAKPPATYSPDFAGMNEEWLKWFPSNPPARQGAKAAFAGRGSESLHCGNR